MTARAVLTPLAETELREAVRRIALDNPQAAQRLRGLVDAAAVRIGERPLLGRIEPALARPRYRFWSLPAFSLLLVYNAEVDPVRIIRIVHTARDLPKVLKHLGS